MLINLFLLGASMLITYYALPNQHQRLEKKAKDEKVEKLNALQKELQTLKQQRDQGANSARTNMEEKLLIVSYQEELLNHIQAFCKETIKGFQMENILKRKDNFPQVIANE